MKKKLLPLLLILSILLTGCAYLESEMQNFKGSLIGDKYTIEFYDNYGAKFLTSKGERIDLSGNYVSTIQPDGAETIDLSSVVTVTIDGHNLETTGSTVIFEGDGLTKLKDFSINETYSQADGIASLTSVSRNINEIKNLYGVSKVVVIQSQMGVPICAFGGDNVYWEIPDDLPKTTKLMIDGKPLYIHRANYVMMDQALLN